MSRKMRNIFIFISIICYVIILSACFKSDPSPTAAPTTTTPSATPTVVPTLEPTAVPTVVPRAEPNDFSLIISDQYISVKEWDNEINLEEILGKPISQEDTVTGSGYTEFCKKNLEFDGLQITLYSPKSNCQTFWIQEMDVSKKGVKSLKGIEVGDTVEEVKKIYPDINNNADGRIDPDNTIYDIQDEDNNYLHFEIKEGIVDGIKVFRLIN